MHLVGDRERLAIARVQRRLLGVMTTEVEAHMATNHQRQVPHRQYKFRSRRWLSGRVRTVRAMPKRHL